MKTHHKLAIAVATGALAAAGTGVAVGAAGDGAKQDEAAILSAAAKRLDTSPQELREALRAAVDARLDQAVEDGRLTPEQADAIRRHREESGSVLGFAPRGPHGPGPHLAMSGSGPLTHVAKALGIGERRLFRRLHAGRTLSEIAEAEGKDVDEVKAAAKAGAEEDLAQAVEEGALTREQADERLAHLDRHLDDLAEHGLPARPRFHRRGGPPFPPPGPGERGAAQDGNVMPAPAPAFGA